MEQQAVKDSVHKIRFLFKKEERLSSKKIINRLFSEGESFLAYPVKIIFLKTTLPTSFPAQVAFTVSKKNVKKAVHRNRIKRLMREAYRLNKNELYQLAGDNQHAIFFIFIGKKIPDFKQVQSAIKKIIAHLSRNHLS
jgi:ribonuclease P protein component